MNSLLKFITCGSVDNGKSTLIGHILYGAKTLFADQEKVLILESKTGARDGKIDYSLLLDGLIAEREQAITIDVAYRYFTTNKRSFIVADTPGHEEYTRNMAVGASFADLALILVDVTQGILVQTKRHIRICKMMGIENFVFAINKMDIVFYNEEIFRKVHNQIENISKELNLNDINIIPVSATEGDNVIFKSDKMPWYNGKSILTCLEDIDINNNPKFEKGFYMPVQYVCRPNYAFRGFQGQIESGEIRVKDNITVLPSGESGFVKSIFVGNKEKESAIAGQPVTITLDRDVDVSRGCVLIKDSEIQTSRTFLANLLWMDDFSLREGGEYFVKLGTKKTTGKVKKIIYKIDINSGQTINAKEIYKNELAFCEIVLDEALPIDLFEKHKTLGEFILINRLSNMTSACGVVKKIDKTNNYFILPNFCFTLWFTGLSGSGKSTIAKALKEELEQLGLKTVVLDGDELRQGLSEDLGFTESDRREHNRRVAEVCKVLNQNNIVVISATISPFSYNRLYARNKIENFIEVYISTPLEECIKRDVKGLYKKAMLEKKQNFTGISSKYEIPVNPEISIDTTDKSIEDCVKLIIDWLCKMKYFKK